MENLARPNYIDHMDEHRKSAYSKDSCGGKLGLSAWALERLLILLTIWFGFKVQKEVSHSIVAVILHVLFSIVPTGFVFWNKSLPIKQTARNAVKFWISNILFLTKPLSSTRERGKESCEKKRPELCDLEAKLKGSYTRLLFSFFTIIPACFVQYYFLFQSSHRAYKKPCAFDLLRIAAIATGLFNTATCVYEYDDLTIEYELQSQIEESSSAVKFRTDFWKYLRHICQRVTLTAYLAYISPFFAVTYTISNFATNYVLLKHMPQLENSYVNVSHGTHSTQSFWTFRIINVISGVGTRLNLDLKNRYYCALLSKQCPSRTIWWVLVYHKTQLLFLVLSLMIAYLHLGCLYTYILVLCFYFATVTGDFLIDILSFPFGGSVFGMEYERIFIEP